MFPVRRGFVPGSGAELGLGSWKHWQAQEGLPFYLFLSLFITAVCRLR